MSTTIYTKRIIVPNGNVKRIAAEIGVSDQAVRNALRFITEGEQPDRIRKEALENYGGAISTISREKVCLMVFCLAGINVADLYDLKKDQLDGWLSIFKPLNSDKITSAFFSINLLSSLNNMTSLSKTSSFNSSVSSLDCDISELSITLKF